MKSFFIENKEIRWPIIQGGKGVGVWPSGQASAVAGVRAGSGLLYKQNSYGYLWGFKEELRRVCEKTKDIFYVFLLKLLIKQGVQWHNQKNYDI